MDIDLGPGQVTGVRFPVRVDKVGRQTMTVKGTGGTVSDAVARSVLVVPDGQAVPVATSGALGAGTITNTVNFPAAAVAGSPQLYVNIYPAYLSQVIGGMDSLLRVPNGCFEQTTSTAWPNVLVTGSWKGDQSEFFTFQTSLVRNTAFVVWALASAGYTPGVVPAFSWSLPGILLGTSTDEACGRH
jgi:uncharacterized protein YfaS (alpha-2-macroglobulin family)